MNGGNCMEVGFGEENGSREDVYRRIYQIKIILPNKENKRSHAEDPFGQGFPD